MVDERWTIPSWKGRIDKIFVPRRFSSLSDSLYKQPTIKGGGGRSIADC
jgi:hypothetical protein